MQETCAWVSLIPRPWPVFRLSSRTGRAWERGYAWVIVDFVEFYINYIPLQYELFYTMYILCTGKMKVYNCIQYHLTTFCSGDRSSHLSVALTLPTRHAWYGLHNVFYSGWLSITPSLLFPGRACLLHDCSCMLTFACKHQTCCINDIQRNIYDCPTFCGMLRF